MNLTNNSRNDESKTSSNQNTAKTSTPLNDDKIIKNHAFNFISPPDYNTQTIHTYRINQRSIDNEIKIKETYVKHLKSIDLAKYSFPNEYIYLFFSFKLIFAP